jgi:tRNA-dihydrouridine synthase B
MHKHLEQLYSFYGHTTGVRIARKHINWYLKQLGNVPITTKNLINQAENPTQQITAVDFAFTLLFNEFAA